MSRGSVLAAALSARCCVRYCRARAEHLDCHWVNFELELCRFFIGPIASTIIPYYTAPQHNPNTHIKRLDEPSDDQATYLPRPFNSSPRGLTFTIIDIAGFNLNCVSGRRFMSKIQFFFSTLVRVLGILHAYKNFTLNITYL